MSRGVHSICQSHSPTALADRPRTTNPIPGIYMSLSTSFPCLSVIASSRGHLSLLYICHEPQGEEASAPSNLPCSHSYRTQPKPSRGSPPPYPQSHHHHATAAAARGPPELDWRVRNRQGCIPHLQRRQPRVFPGRGRANAVPTGGGSSSSPISSHQAVARLLPRPDPRARTLFPRATVPHDGCRRRQRLPDEGQAADQRAAAVAGR